MMAQTSTLQTVLVTGANGFIAQHCVAALLRDGHAVIGTVRSATKADIVRQTHCKHPGLRVLVVEDITSKDNYLDALQGLKPSAIFHLAAPFDYTAKDLEREVMVPALHGTLAILEVASKLGSVRRFIHTNSFACIFDAAKGPRPEKTYSANDWSPLAYKDGTGNAQPAVAYRASKVVAERAAWNYIKSEQPSFDLVSLCPAMVFGPFLQGGWPKDMESLNTSNGLVWAAVSGGEHARVAPTKGPVWVDVRDVADAHVKALTTASAGNGRFLLAASVYCNQELADVSRRLFPELSAKIPRGTPGARESSEHYGIDTRETEDVLGMRWRSLECSLKGMIPELFRIGQSANAQPIQ